ncbi:MAG: PEP-CTERM sorting domain-containing protein [Verrucomicrobiaceae bacterium]|nr:MAG: PEP-CTERM sorting domain-containing protein [Verrucomicrobiaceae bacterium]
MSATFVVVPVTAPLLQAAVVTNTFNLDLTGVFDDITPASKTTLVDFNNDGVDDFSFTHSTNPVPTPSGISKTDYNGVLTLDAASASLFLTVAKDYAQENNFAENLTVGATVGLGTQTYISLQPGGSPPWDNRLYDSSGEGNAGAFAGGEPFATNGYGYIGFQFGDSANPNYGYMEFSGLGGNGIPDFGNLNGATLSTISYETTPGASITVVPEPSSLALLAGGAGVALLRRRRSRA